MFRLSQRSLDRLEGVKPDLVNIVKRAIELTKVDFGVIEGVRTEERQKELVAKGAKNIHDKNSKPITKDVIPVFPPAFTPAPDST